MSAPRFAYEAAVVFRGRPMRVAGLLQLQSAAGQRTFRYLLQDDAGAPVILEEGDGRFTLMRAFPPAAQPQVTGSTVGVGEERYSLVGVRRLQVVEALGMVPGATAADTTLLSGIFEGPAGTLMRELVPGEDRQVYYLVKPLAPGELLSAVEHDALREAERRAAGEREED